jgi:hypothetical protein
VAGGGGTPCVTTVCCGPVLVVDAGGGSQTRILDPQAVADFRIRLPHCSKRRDAAPTQGKKLAAAHHDFRVQILNVAAVLPTRDSNLRCQTSNADDRMELRMFSHVARELGAHPCIGSRASDQAGELQDLGVARVIAATAIDGEVPMSTETICRSIETEGA